MYRKEVQITRLITLIAQIALRLSRRDSFETDGADYLRNLQSEYNLRNPGNQKVGI